MPKIDKPICMTAPVSIQAAEGESQGPSKFEVVAYTGGPMVVGGWDLPVVVDLDGMEFGNSLVANLDHDRTKRVGHVTSKQITDGKLILSGVASAVTEARREVIESAAEPNNFVWQASIEANPKRVTTLSKGKATTVNGQTVTGPAYIASQSILKGFAFVSHGADDNTTVSIAAEAADSNRRADMDPKLKSWIEGMGFDVESLEETQLAGLTANYQGQQSTPNTIVAKDPFEAHKIEAKRKEDIREFANRTIEMRASSHAEIIEIEGMVNHAIEASMSVAEFRVQLLEAMVPQGRTIHAPKREKGIDAKTIEAAICQAGNLQGHEDQFTDQQLQAAHDQFRGNIGLKEVIIECARANGYSGRAFDVNEDVLRFAFAKHQPIHATGFSTISISTILSNNANKFLRVGWDSVDMTPTKIAPVRNVRNFQQITTVSLTGDLQFDELGPAGQIKHGELGERTYTNQADTYARMLAITRKDIINDDLGALTSVPRRLGRGAALKLNDLFWTVFLNNSSFFASGNANVSTDTGALGLTGLQQADTIFMNQTDPDGKPLGVMPAILLVPTALKATALQLMTSEKIKGDADEPDGNVWRGRFRVESSPYMSNTSYTGYSAVAWYLLADPMEMPVIEIAALNGRVEPVIETADADFNTLGIQMRGYSDVGVALQEFRGGVRADGSAAG